MNMRRNKMKIAANFSPSNTILIRFDFPAVVIHKTTLKTFIFSVNLQKIKNLVKPDVQ